MMKRIVAAALLASLVGCAGYQPKTYARGPYGTMEPAEVAAQQWDNYRATQERERMKREAVERKYINVGPDLRHIRGGVNPRTVPATALMLDSANVNRGGLFDAMQGLPGPVVQQIARACGEYATTYKTAAAAANNYSKPRYAQNVGDAAYSFCANQAERIGVHLPDNFVYMATW